MNWLVIGSISGAISVAAGAFGAHALKSKLSPEMLNAFDVGVKYQMFHALALLAVGLIVAKIPAANTAGWLFLIGTVLFSGSLYALSLSGIKFFGPITPIGGLCLIAGWITLAWRCVGNA